MTRERSIRGSADTDRPRPRTRGLCARRPAPAPRPALGDPRHGPPSRGGGGRRARSEGEGLAPGPRSPPLGDTPPPKRPFSPRGGLGVVPTEVASGEAPRVPPSIPLCGPEWYGRWGGAPGLQLPAGDRLLRPLLSAGGEGAALGPLPFPVRGRRPAAERVRGTQGLVSAPGPPASPSQPLFLPLPALLRGAVGEKCGKLAAEIRG